jgi:hypothetical protein
VGVRPRDPLNVAGATAVKVTGLEDLVRGLKGPLFKAANRELRQFSKLIAQDLVPHVEAGVRRSRAPQAPAMARTVRVHSDRVPVVVVGKVNPRFHGSRFRGGNTRSRRGAMALGVVSGPAGGRRDTQADENYYQIPRSGGWGPLGAALRGPILRQGATAYLRAYVSILKAHGFDARTR